MADKTTGELQAVKVDELPAAPDIYDDFKLPGELQGEAVHVTGAQLKGYAAASVSPLADAAAASAAAAGADAAAAKKSAETAEGAKTAAQSALAGVQEALDNLPEGGTLVINDLTTGGASAALSAEMGKELGRRPNPSMLPNGYLVRPVNQRGQTEYATDASEWVYTVDGWKMRIATLTVGDGFCNFTAKDEDETVSKRITQLTEQTLKAGETYTLSMLAQVNDIGGTANLRPCTANYGPVKGVQGKFIAAADDAPALYTYTFTPIADAVNAGVEILIGNTAGDYIDMDIYAIKLERGGIQTLAHQDSGGNWVLNEIPDYGEELARCQRYQQVYHAIQYGQFWPAAAATTTNAKVCIQTPAELRASPAITFDTSCLVLYDGTTEYPITAVSLYTRSSNAITISLTTSGLTAGKTYMVRAAEVTKIILDANL